MTDACPVCVGSGRVATTGGSSACHSCGGSGRLDDQGAAPAPGGDLALIAMIALGLAGLMALILAIQLWQQAVGVLRPMLETVPGDTVADSADEHGRPVVIGVLVAIAVLAGSLWLSAWRRGLIRDYLRGERSYWSLYAASLLRMTAILAGIALIPVAAAIADGADLRADPDEGTLLDASWRFIVAGAGIAAFTFLGLGRRVGKESLKPLPAGDPIPAASYRR